MADSRAVTDWAGPATLIGRFWGSAVLVGQRNASTTTPMTSEPRIPITAAIRHLVWGVGSGGAGGTVALELVVVMDMVSSPVAELDMRADAFSTRCLMIHKYS